jgi:hypothetical protein
MNKLKNEIVIL